MATWDAFDVVQISPNGTTITVEFTLVARFTKAVDAVDLEHKARYQKAVTGADANAKKTNFISQVETPATGMLALIRKAQLDEDAKTDLVTKALPFTIANRDAGSVA